MTSARPLLVLVLVASVSAFASPAFGAPQVAVPEDVERARTFFDAGAAAYASANYRDAVRSFERAYALAPRPAVLFSLAQAERKEYLASSNPVYLRRASRGSTRRSRRGPSASSGRSAARHT